MNAPVLYLIVPCYNEEEALPITVPQMCDFMNGLIKAGKVSENSRITLVNDGSRDNTWDIIEGMASNNTLIRGIKLAHNRGHQNAVWAGMMETVNDYDCMVSMDCDLQDDINAINEFLKEYENGCQIVYGVRSKREKDTAFKRITAEGFYKVLSKMGVETVYNHADYRLMSKQAVLALGEYSETNMYLRGMVPTLGFKTAKVFYERGVRPAGESKYPLKKMIALAMEGITSFSVKPIRYIVLLGAIFSFVSLLVLIYSLISYAAGRVIPGWTSIMCSIWFIGGLQLMALGLIGEYVGKTYLETKRRPRYIIEKDTDKVE